MHVRTRQSIAKALLPYHAAGWRSADSNPHFSKQGRDWSWSSNEPQTQRNANKLIKHSWEWLGQRSPETPRTPWPLWGLLARLAAYVPIQLRSTWVWCNTYKVFPLGWKGCGCPRWQGGGLAARGCLTHSDFRCFVAGRVRVWPCWLLSQCPREIIQNHWFSFPVTCFCPCSGVIFDPTTASRGFAGTFRQPCWGSGLWQQGVLWGPLLPNLSLCQGIFCQRCLCQLDWPHRFQPVKGLQGGLVTSFFHRCYMNLNFSSEKYL